MNTSMSANNNNNASDTTMMRLSQFVSSLGSTWTAKDEEPSPPCVKQSVNVRTVAIPSFCMDLEDEHRQQHHGMSLHSQISDLMSRKVHMQAETAQERAIPSRYILENVLTSFEDLVDARIRAYGQILSNHVQGLREAQQQAAAALALASASSSALLDSHPQSSHNARGALIADYKLRTFLDIATKDASFTSITTKFDVLQEISDDDDDGDDATTSTTSITSTMNDEDERTNSNIVSLPIEMTVEITSENLPLQQQQYHGHHHHHHYKQGQQQEKGETTTRTTQKKIVIFKIQGRIQGTSRSRKQKYCRVGMFVLITREL